MSTDSQYARCREFAAGLATGGIEVVAVGAGSRSTPLVLAFHDDGRFKVFSHVDERAAAFFALGAARVTGKPAAVVTTSGTAAANLLPAVAEARAAGIPVIALTADRPPELHDVGAMQTIEQTALLSPALWFADLHAYDDDAPAANVAALTAAFSVGPPRGPVHVNVRLREPLVPSAEARTAPVDVPPTSRRDAGSIVPASSAIALVAERLAAKPRGLIYTGHLEGGNEHLAESVVATSQATGYPVIAEATSRLRGKLEGARVVDAAEALVRSETFEMDHRPDAVIRIGRAPLTRRMQEWLDGSGAIQVVVTDELPWSDPGHIATDVIAAGPAEGLRALASKGGAPVKDLAWSKAWVESGATAREAIDAHLDAAPMFEGTAVRSVARSLPKDALLYVGTSLPIRALDAFVTATAPLEAYANRGASGIDGTLSGAIGAAAATGRPVASLTGDLAFLHDVGGLLAVARHRIPLVAIVIDNGGGGIFDFLPQAEGVEKQTFDDLFATSHEIDLMRAAELYGMQFAAVRDQAALEKSLSWAFTEGGSWVIRVPVRRDASVEAHRAAWERAAEALSR